MRPLRFPALWLALGWLLVLGVVVVSLVPGPAGVHLSGTDKLLHLVAYSLLALWFGGVYRPARYPALAFWLLALGLVLELAQGHVTRRGTELADMAANAAGVTLGVLVAWRYLGLWCLWVESRLLRREH